MASYESYYASPSLPSSPTTSAPPQPPPPPPPPKPAHSQEPSRSGTPLHNTTTTIAAGGPPPPPPPPHPRPTASPSATSTPPTPAQQPQPQAGSESVLLQQHQHQQQQQQHQQQQQPIPPPTQSDQWLPGSLASHSISDLQSLLSNPSLVNAFAQSHPSFASSTVPVTALLQSNAGLARQIAALEAQLRQLRHDTAQALLNHTSLQTQWRRKQREMDDALSPWGPRAMYQRLVSSIAEQEALLAAMTDSFLDVSAPDNAYYHDGPTTRLASDKEVVDWLRRVREATATLEKRREMRARWDEGRVGGWR